MISFILLKKLKYLVPPDPGAEISMHEYDGLLCFRIDFDVVDGLAVG